MALLQNQLIPRARSRCQSSSATGTETYQTRIISCLSLPFSSCLGHILTRQLDHRSELNRQTWCLQLDRHSLPVKVQHLLDLLVARRHDILDDRHQQLRLHISYYTLQAAPRLACGSRLGHTPRKIRQQHVPCTYICLPIQRPHNDPPHRLQLDLIRPLLERVPKLGRGGALEEVVMDDGIARRGRVHGGLLRCAGYVLKVYRGERYGKVSR